MEIGKWEFFSPLRKILRGKHGGMQFCESSTQISTHTNSTLEDLETLAPLMATYW